MQSEHFFLVEIPTRIWGGFCLLNILTFALLVHRTSHRNSWLQATVKVKGRNTEGIIDRSSGKLKLSSVSVSFHPSTCFLIPSRWEIKCCQGFHPQRRKKKGVHVNFWSPEPGLSRTCQKTIKRYRGEVRQRSGHSGVGGGGRSWACCVEHQLSRTLSSP